MELTERAPFSYDAEQSVLGAIIKKPELFDTIVEQLRPEDFYTEANRRIYECMCSMHATSVPIDYVTLLERVRADGIFGEADGKQYLLSLADLVPSVENAGRYAQIISDKATLRHLMEACDSIREKARDAAESPEIIVDYAEQQIYEISDVKGSTSFYTMREGITESLKRYEELQTGDRDKYQGLPTGFASLDKILVGMRKGDLIILAARPGVGKSALALNIAVNVALAQRKKVAFFSLEMGTEEILDRIISLTAMVENTKLQTGDLAEEDWARISESTARLYECRLFIDESSNPTASQIKAKLRRLKDVDLVVIDYIQLMQSGMRRNDNRVQEVSEITRAVKLMAKELQVPVIALAQVSRRAGDGEEPHLSDLRESGSIEQDADSVIFLFNEFKATNDPAKKNMMKVSVGKNRHGSTGITELEWLAEYTRFGNLALETRYDDTNR